MLFLLNQVPSCFSFVFLCIRLSSFALSLCDFLAEVVSFLVFFFFLDAVVANSPRMHFILPRRLNGGASLFPPGITGQSVKTPAAAELNPEPVNLHTED